MTPVLTVPAVLDERAIDVLASQVGTAPVGKRAVVDARQVRSADPSGATGLLVLGHALAQTTGRRPLLQLPRNRDGVERFTRLGFGPAALEVFELSAGDRGRMGGEPGTLLLGLTAIRSAEDACSVVDTVSDRAGPVLAETLGYDEPDVAAFGSMLRELLHNVDEPAPGPGWACLQAHRRLRRINRPAVAIAVASVGAAFQEPIEGALSENQALARVYEQVRCWGGQISIRSGTARLFSSARREESPTLEAGLAPLPGAQISVLLPGCRVTVREA